MKPTGTRKGESGHRLAGIGMAAVLSMIMLASCSQAVSSIDSTQGGTRSRAVSNVYGPYTMYTPPPGMPRFGVLYPRAIQLSHSGANNGTMFATFEKYTPVPFTFPIFKSTNNGVSWTRLTDVTDQVNGWGLKQEPFLFELPQQIGSMPAGTLLCAGNSEPNDDSHTKIDIYKSNDLGASWTFVSSVASGGAATTGTGTAIWEPFLMVANNKLFCFYSDERGMASGGQKLVAETSTDGISWSAAFDVVNLSVAHPTYRPGMAVVSKMANGNYFLTWEGVGESGLPTMSKITSDPTNWNPTVDGTPIRNGGGSPYNAVMPNGWIVVGDYGSSDIFINVSNGTGFWQNQATPVQGAYSRCLLPLADGTLFVMSAGVLNENDTNTVTYADMRVYPYFKVTNKATGLALDGMGLSAPGSIVAQYTVNVTNNQLWQNVPLGNGYFKIVNVATGLRLDNLGHTGNGSTEGQYSDSGSTNQQWNISPAGSYWKIINRTSGLCVDTGGLTGSGSTLQQWASGSSDNQLWTFSPD